MTEEDFKKLSEDINSKIAAENERTQKALIVTRKFEINGTAVRKNPDDRNDIVRKGDRKPISLAEIRKDIGENIKGVDAHKERLRTKDNQSGGHTL